MIHGSIELDVFDIQLEILPPHEFVFFYRIADVKSVAARDSFITRSLLESDGRIDLVWIFFLDQVKLEMIPGGPNFFTGTILYKDR